MASSTADEVSSLTRTRNSFHFIVAFFVACTVISVSLVIVDSSSIHEGRNSRKCSNPSIRKEWRLLSTSEQHGYISAVQCLSGRASSFDDGSSRYDDFALAHISEGLHIHYAAAFLPWHRHFIDTFEKTLRGECQYNGSLAYGLLSFAQKMTPG